MVCLCWRCTRAGTTSDPDVVLLRWAFWMQGDLILFITGVGSTQMAPMDSDICSVSTPTLVGGQCNGA